MCSAKVPFSSIYQSGATQHRVATDAPGGALKIRPILLKARAIYPIDPLQGTRLNANRWAAIISFLSWIANWLIATIL